MKNSGIIIAGIAVAISLVISSKLIGDAYMAKVQAPSIPYINADLSGIEKAMGNKDSMLVYELADYLGMNGENMDVFERMIRENKIEGLPYVKINEVYIFSKKAIDQWLYDSSLKKYKASAY